MITKIKLIFIVQICAQTYLGTNACADDPKNISIFTLRAGGEITARKSSKGYEGAPIYINGELQQPTAYQMYQRKKVDRFSIENINVSRFVTKMRERGFILINPPDSRSHAAGIYLLQDIRTKAIFVVVRDTGAETSAIEIRFPPLFPHQTRVVLRPIFQIARDLELNLELGFGGGHVHLEFNNMIQFPVKLLNFIIILYNYPILQKLFKPLSHARSRSIFESGSHVFLREIITDMHKLPVNEWEVYLKKKLWFFLQSFPKEINLFKISQFETLEIRFSDGFLNEHEVTDFMDLLNAVWTAAPLDYVLDMRYFNLYTYNEALFPFKSTRDKGVVHEFTEAVETLGLSITRFKPYLSHYVRERSKLQNEMESFWTVLDNSDFKGVPNNNSAYTYGLEMDGSVSAHSEVFMKGFDWPTQLPDPSSSYDLSGFPPSYRQYLIGMSGLSGHLIDEYLQPIQIPPDLDKQSISCEMLF